MGKFNANGVDVYRELARCDLFTTGILSLKKSTVINTKESFVSLVVLDGNVNIGWEGNNTLTAKKGDSVFVPAGLTVELTGEAGILISYV